MFVLGSAVKGEELPGSGLDVLIVSGEVPEDLGERVDVISELEREPDLPERHPIEFRLATPEECEKVRRVLLDGCEGFLTDRGR
jgi:predicted nucleotidyltransferase